MELTLLSRQSDETRLVFIHRLARSDTRRKLACLSRATHLPIMSDNREKIRRRAGRPPAGAKDGEKVTDYPQLSVRVPHEMKHRLNALSVVTGLAQWRIVVEALECFFHDLSPTDRELVQGISQRMSRGS